MSLGTVAVMDIEVDDRNPLEALVLQRIGGGHGHVVEQAKSHGAIRGRVMPAGPYGAKRIDGAFVQHLVDRQQSGARGAPRRRQGILIHRRIRIQLQIAFPRRTLEDQVNIGSAVHALEVRVGGQRRLAGSASPRAGR